VSAVADTRGVTQASRPVVIVENRMLCILTGGCSVLVSQEFAGSIKAKFRSRNHLETGAEAGPNQ
jgi:hypothetical protein